MRLCFGTFATVLIYCRKNISKSALIARIVNTIDSQSRYKGENMTGDGPAINRLLSCEIDFVLSSREATKIPEQDTVVNNFTTDVIPYIHEDKKANIILTLLDIISRDKFIDFEKSVIFKKYFKKDKQDWLRKSDVELSKLLAEILLYTTCGSVDNKVGKTYVKTITTDYIDNITKSYKDEFLWDTSKQILTLSSINMFNIFEDAIQANKIDAFIQNIDPTNQMNIENIESCENFLEYTKDNIWLPFGKSAISWTLRKIQQFAQTLDDYTNYLGPNMRPIVERPDTLVPLHRDENPKWALEFEKETKNYRLQLISIYQEIYNHMPFAPKLTSEHSE